MVRRRAESRPSTRRAQNSGWPPERISGSQNLRACPVVLALLAVMLEPKVANVAVQVPDSRAPSMRWYRGNTHTHTINSSGDRCSRRNGRIVVQAFEINLLRYAAINLNRSSECP